MKNYLKDKLHEHKKHVKIEFSLVSSSHTIVNPWTMMIIHRNTSLTDITMLRSFRP